MSSVAPAPPVSIQVLEHTEHDYFERLQARADYYKGFSLRDQAQLLLYRNATSQPAWVTFDPSDPHDAAKVTIPVMAPTVRSTLSSAVDATQTTLSVSYWSGEFYNGRVGQIDGEYVFISTIDKPNLRIVVSRGAYGTTKAPHAAAAPITLNTNSLINQVRLPIGTQNGHPYLFTWDTLWTASYLRSGLSNHKTFQFSNSADNLWLEQQTRYAPGGYGPSFNPATDVAVLTLRGYAALGPGVTGPDPLGPRAGTFYVKPDRWIRQWVWIDTQASPAYNRISYWVADAERSVQLLDQLQMTGYTVAKFWLEFNTSQDRYVRSTPRDLIAYVRNVAVLKDIAVADVPALLTRPLAAAA